MRPKKHRAVLITLFAALLPSSHLALALWETSSSEPTVEQLLQRTDDLMRGESSEGKTTMRVKTARWDRTMTMKSWSEGTQKTLIQILSPPKERGTATLKVENNIWNYLPKVDRTIKVPASMMSGAWMGSHFTNDDLVKNSRFSEDYTCEFLEKPTDRSQGHYVINCVPKPQAPVVWGKVLIEIRAVDELVDDVAFYDEDDKLVRTFTYDDIGDIGGRKLPRRVTVVPADKPEEFTQITYDELKFDVNHPERLFTLQALRK
jgi:hypothetical protein